jgi:CheY-like chemotaxis protein
LGLSVVYGIVNQSCGFITVVSEPGRGTEFRIHLPAALEMPGPSLQSKQEPVRGGSETVLLVEDEAALREKVREVLANAGYRVLAAADADSALDIAIRRKERIHLLLIDVVMPEVSGPLLAERLRTIRPDTKVMFMSGYPDLASVDPEFRSRPNFIQKPFSEKELLRGIRRVLDGNNVRDCAVSRPGNPDG